MAPSDAKTDAQDWMNLEGRVGWDLLVELPPPKKKAPKSVPKIVTPLS